MAGKNIQRYQAMLDKETDPARRRTLERLLAEERSVHAALDDVEQSQSLPPPDRQES